MPSAFPGGTLTEATTNSKHGTMLASHGAPAAGELAAAAATSAAGGKGRVVEDSNVTVAVRVRPLTQQVSAPGMLRFDRFQPGLGWAGLGFQGPLFTSISEPP
jgi:hypothetical protein